MGLRRRAWLVCGIACLSLRANPVRAGDDAFEVDAPIEREFVPKTFPVAGRVPDVPSPVVAVNGVEVEVKGGHFKTFLTAPREGEFKVRVAFGAQGRPATAIERIVRVDATPPILTILEPAGPVGEVTGPEAVVRGIVEDASLHKLEVNGVPAAIGPGGRFSTSLMLAKGAEVHVVLVASDQVGNETREERTLRRSGPAGTPNVPGAPAPRGTPLPAATGAVDLCFVLDRAVPSTVDDVWGGAKAALIELTWKAEKGDRLGIYSYDATAHVELELATPPPLAGWFPKDSRRTATREGLRAALELAATELRRSTASVRHIVLVVGSPSASHPDLARVVPDLAQSGLTLSIIAPGGPARASGLAALASAAGGRLFTPQLGPELLRTFRGEIALVSGNRKKPASAAAPVRPANAPDVPAAFALLSPTVRSAVDWLRAHQSPDGRWEAAGFGGWYDAQAVEGGISDGPGKSIYDVGVTGLALLALLSADANGRSGGAFGGAVITGLRYLRSVQDEQGCFGSREHGHFVYNHAIATLAMVEAFSASASPVDRESAQRALDFVALSRSEHYGWRYGVRPADSDSSVTAWMGRALFAAKGVNGDEVRANRPPAFRVDDEAIDGLKNWFDKITDPDSGRAGYQNRRGGPARPASLVDAFPAARSESLTAAGLMTRQALGEHPSTDAMKLGMKLCLDLRPRWDPRDGSIDLIYWHFGSRVMTAAGGPPARLWLQALEGALVSSQRLTGELSSLKGSWDPIDPWGRDGGRVYMTAMAVLCLQGPKRLH